MRLDFRAADREMLGSDRQLAVLLVILDEINALRLAAGLPERTRRQAVQAYRDKLQQVRGE